MGISSRGEPAKTKVARFFSLQHTKTGENIPNEHKIYQKALKIPYGHKIYRRFPFQGPPKCTQIVIFGIKIYHLATLAKTIKLQIIR
jgi:hypothetical protein